MTITSIKSSIAAGKDHLLARLTKDLTSHRYLWNYLYMGLYVFIAMWLTIFYAAVCGNTVITMTAGLVGTIFTNVVWSKAYEKKNKEPENATVTSDAKIDPNEVGASD